MGLLLGRAGRTRPPSQPAVRHRCVRRHRGWRERGWRDDGQPVPVTRPTSDREPAPAVRAMVAGDAAAVLAIYQAGIDTGQATFETAAPGWDTFAASRLPDHRLIVADPYTDTVLGWAALSPVSDRCVYVGVAETSIYVHPDARGRGVGQALLRALVESSERAGIWTLQAGIFPENAASLALHEKAGFRLVGRRERIGRHHGVWRDVLFLERRSPVVS